MVDFEFKPCYNIEDLRALVKVLRSEGGCPWDREQTHESVRRDFIEEVYEVVEAIDEKSPEHLREELGDVLFQVAFHAEMEEEKGGFDLNSVADGVVKKLILRHPHVFGEVKVSGSDEVLKNWDDIKRREKSQKTAADAMDSVARSLPALWRAEKVSKKAAKAGFDWDGAEPVCDKLEEELGELRAALGGKGDIKEELGDLLFTAVNIARKLKIDPEEALNASTDKFISRFSKMETSALSAGKELGRLSHEEQNELWENSKKVI